MTTLDLPTFLLLALVICGIVGVVLLVSRVAAGRADPRPELGFIAGQRVEFIIRLLALRNEAQGMSMVIDGFGILNDASNGRIHLRRRTPEGPANCQ